RLRTHLKEGSGFVIRNRERPHGPGLCAVDTDLCGLRCRRAFVFGHEFGRPREPWQRHILETRPAEIESRSPVTIYETVNMLRLLHRFTASHSLVSLEGIT